MLTNRAILSPAIAHRPITFWAGKGIRRRSGSLKTSPKQREKHMGGLPGKLIEKPIFYIVLEDVAKISASIWVGAGRILGNNNHTLYYNPKHGQPLEVSTV